MNTIQSMTLAALACVLLLPFLNAKEADAGKGDVPASTMKIIKPAIDHAAIDKLGWKISCAAYTFHLTDLVNTLEILKGLGIRYIDINPKQRYSKLITNPTNHLMPPEALAEMLQKIKDSGITVLSYGVADFGTDEESARKVFEFAKKLGAQTIAAEPFETMLPLLDKLSDEYKINIAIHDHPKPSKYWNPESVLTACKDRSNRIGACADVGHWLRSGLVPLDGLKKLEGHIISLHFKDLAEGPNGKGFIDTPWGAGKCDCKAMLAEIKRQGIHVEFAIEYESTTGQQLVDNVAKCVEWFSAQATELAK